jgi:methionine synthase II (cobalamin-independent)
MTESTQADRDAAAEAFFCKPLLNEKHNDDRRVKAFARHRQYGYDQGYYDGRKYDGANDRIEALQADNAKLRKALAEQVEACFCPDCGMCFRHEQLLKETGQ